MKYKLEENSLTYLKDLLDDDKYYTEELEDSYIHLNSAINNRNRLEKEKRDLIKYLEDKIKEELSNIIVDSEKQAIHKNTRVYAFKEILDKIKEDINDK